MDGCAAWFPADRAADHRRSRVERLDQRQQARPWYHLFLLGEETPAPAPPAFGVLDIGRYLRLISAIFAPVSARKRLYRAGNRLDVNPGRQRRQRCWKRGAQGPQRQCPGRSLALPL
ncbi:hypothetical protein AvCA_04560 [Azotobacter vinelandii CA]|uniref:Uncharacterized protein n=2 Tax=Azotobacter vinelandii TaxID=354 RepID=C1DJC6_AZOVD|nr:hypothetical protein Avin_04560 [Azotobacter vinelandii DJ]AGK15603.1 hypothetical protein AvCA_04560 [Azotobacter vinelandii CA]AGK19309.1 hypothetical protein AvCA6_04560 [Azotobacter vinelandii CA6]